MIKKIPDNKHLSWQAKKVSKLVQGVVGLSQLGTSMYYVITKPQNMITKDMDDPQICKGLQVNL